MKISPHQRQQASSRSVATAGSASQSGQRRRGPASRASDVNAVDVRSISGFIASRSSDTAESTGRPRRDAMACTVGASSAVAGGSAASTHSRVNESIGSGSSRTVRASARNTSATRGDSSGTRSRSITGSCARIRADAARRTASGSRPSGGFLASERCCTCRISSQRSSAPAGTSKFRRNSSIARSKGITAALPSRRAAPIQAGRRSPRARARLGSRPALDARMSPARPCRARGARDAPAT